MAKSLKRNFDVVAEGRRAAPGERKYVVAYKDASPDLRKKMEAVIAPLDAAPADYNIVNKFGAHLVDEITALYKKVDRMSQETLLENAEKLLPKAQAALYEIDGYIGTMNEVLRRYKEVYIPDVVAKAESGTTSYNDYKRYKQLEQRREDFIDRAPLLEAARALGSIVVQRLESSVEQKELLDIIRATGFVEDYVKPRKQAAKNPGIKP